MEITQNAFEDVATALGRADTLLQARWRALPQSGSADCLYNWAYVNGLLRTQIAKVQSVDTRYLREILVVGGNYERWLQLIKQEIIPFMLVHELPR